MVLLLGVINESGLGCINDFDGLKHFGLEVYLLLVYLLSHPSTMR